MLILIIKLLQYNIYIQSYNVLAERKIGVYTENFA